jgi:hypothetical protein
VRTKTGSPPVNYVPGLPNITFPDWPACFETSAVQPNIGADRVDEPESRTGFLRFPLPTPTETPVGSAVEHD